VEFSLPEGTRIKELLDEMIRRHPALKCELLDDQGQLYQHVHIFIGGRDIMHLKGLETPLAADEVLGVFPAVGGG
jgi:molybdopterin synthase sulfur carrier subunit